MIVPSPAARIVALYACVRAAPRNARCSRAAPHARCSFNKRALRFDQLSRKARQKRMISLDGLLLLGFGPRLGQAALALNQALYTTSADDGRE